MGVYKHEQASFEGHLLREEYDNIKNDKLIEPCKEEDLIEASLNAIIDVEENYSSIMQAVALHEANCLADTEQSYVYTEANISDFIRAVKRFLLRIWDKIVGLYKRFIMFMDRLSMEDKAFIKKYRKQIFDGKNLSDFTFFGYRYTIIEAEIVKAIGELKKPPPQIWGGQGNLNDIAKKSGETKNINTDTSMKAQAGLEDQIEELRGKVLACFRTGKGKAGKYSNGDFLKELHHCLRNGQDGKEELDQTQLNVTDVVRELMSSADAKKKAKTAFKEGKRCIDEGIKTADSLQSEAFRNSSAIKNPESVEARKMGKGGSDRTNRQAHEDSIRQIGYFLNYTRISKSILISLEGSVLSALRERSRQYKLCLVKIIHHEPDTKKEDADINESARYTFQTEDYISDIKLI